MDATASLIIVDIATKRKGEREARGEDRGAEGGRGQEARTRHVHFLIKAPQCNSSMYIIGRMNVNAIASSPPPLSLSMIQRHDLWFVSVFQDHPSSSGSAGAPPVVNHPESLSLISINVPLLLWSPPSSQPFFFSFHPSFSFLPPSLFLSSKATATRGIGSVPLPRPSAYLLFNKLTNE